MRLPEAVAILESQRKLNDLFTKEENAIMLLQSVLPKLFHDEIICASITFTLHVLKSKAINNETSSSINAGRKKSTADLNSAIKDWLISDYTESRNKRVTMKGLALSVKFTNKLNNLFGEIDSAEIYVFEADSAERMRISEALGDVQSWGWDAWTLHAASKGRPLQALGWHLLHEWGLVKALGLDRAVLRRWLAFVEQHYQLVPYHNSTHAADVLQATHYLLSRCDAGSFLPATTIFAVLIAAMIHDAGHDGLNNLFHQKALTDRALAFNDQSVQEHYHCASVLTRTARDATVNLLAALDPAQAREARRLVILITLATDMKHHGKHTHDFQVSVLKLIVFPSADWRYRAIFSTGRLTAYRAHHDQATVDAHGPSPAAWAADPAALDQLCAHIVHAADISNTCRPFATARRWADRLMKEFRRQGDLERTLGLPVSPLCARGAALTSTSQVRCGAARRARVAASVPRVLCALLVLMFRLCMGVVLNVQGPPWHKDRWSEDSGSPGEDHTLVFLISNTDRYSG